jgi:hypothetical protein
VPMTAVRAKDPEQPAPYVLLLGHGLEMLRIEARAVTAKMVELETAWDGSDE